MNSLKLAAAFGLGVMLAGCGGSAEEDGDEPTEAVSSEAAATPTETSAAPSEAASATPSATAAAATAPAAFAICSACHSVTPGDNGIGPSLAGIYGTKAGEVAGYEFSDAMKKSGLTWDDKTLDSYLTNPQMVVPGTKMSFGGMQDAAKRKDVIAYIKAVK